MLLKRKPTRYYNIRIDSPTYKQIHKLKGKRTIVDFMREQFKVS